jgi:diguanylate cyclase (GGDEF)-like protein
MRSSPRNPALPGRFRWTVGLRLLLALAGLVTFSSAVALSLHNRALARDLERAAAVRLDRAAHAASELVAAHQSVLEERYRAISGTPQLRANLEVQHPPTLAYYAGDLQKRQGAVLIAFVDRGGRAIASAGDAELLATALTARANGLTANAGRPYFVTAIELRSDAGPLGRLVAVDSVDDALVARWSDLCGALLAFHPAESREEFARVVAPLPGLELRVAADLGAERQAMRHARENLAIAGAVSLVLSLLASGLFARGFVRPIRAIQHATERIRSGDFATRIASTRRDEIGDVARAFDGMLDHLQESRAQVAAHLAELTRSRTHLDNAQRRARIGSFEIDLATGEIEGSRQLRALYQLEESDKPIDPGELLARVHPDDRSAVAESIAQAMRNSSPFSADFRVVLPDAVERVVHCQAQVAAGADGKPLRLEGTAQDVTERRRAEEQIRFLAHHDALTGLGNRRMFTDRLHASIEGARRRRTLLGVLFLDLDHFKRINDTLGHTLGDELLRGVAGRLVQSVRASDAIGRTGPELATAISRLGGDEFTILVDGIEDPQQLSLVAARILELLARPFDLGGHEVVVGASIGIAAWPVDGDDVDTLLRNADSAMYHAKEHGRSQYQFYTESMNAAALRRLQMEQRLRAGIARGELEVHYQPKLDLRTEKVAGFEALVRWRDPERGLVSPGEFIPVAEQTGLIMLIGNQVLEQACRQIARWEQDRKGPPGFWRVSVNVSARQFENGDLVETVQRVLAETGARAERLELEITESTVMHDEKSVIATLARLRAIGVAFSLDDFGTGYSSLSYLRSLPVDTLKIDMAFVRNIANSEEDAALTAAIVSMGKARGLRVIAEGVETTAQRRLLTSFGCDEIQGFLIAAALPADQATQVRGESFTDEDES